MLLLFSREQSLNDSRTVRAPPFEAACDAISAVLRRRCPLSRAFLLSFASPAAAAPATFRRAATVGGTSRAKCTPCADQQRDEYVKGSASRMPEPRCARGGSTTLRIFRSRRCCCSFIRGTYPRGELAKHRRRVVALLYRNQSSFPEERLSKHEPCNLSQSAKSKLLRPCRH